nr:RNA polymerase sigma-70 factor [Membranihabitans maritimus]
MIKKGDKEAFNTIYRRYWEYLYTSANYILQDRDACMDVVQEVFVWFWENRNQWNISSPKSYLATAVKFKVTNVIRRGKIKDTILEDLKERMSMEANISSTEAEMEVMELKQIIREFSVQLPVRCQEVFRLSRFEHLTNKEIAQRLGISEKTVENQITIALRKLRTTLGHMAFWLVFFM